MFGIPDFFTNLGLVPSNEATTIVFFIVCSIVAIHFFEMLLWFIFDLLYGVFKQ